MNPLLSTKYHVSYLNGNLDYTSPPITNQLTFYEILSELWVSPLGKPNFLSPTTMVNGGAGGFDYTLKVANVFDDIIINNNLYNFSVEQLFSTYQNHVLCNAD